MRIGIDARYVQDRFPGIGRYIYQLISALAPLASQHQLLVLYDARLPNARYDFSGLAGFPNMALVDVRVRTASVTEQISLPRIISRLALDVFHAPYYVKPYRLPARCVLTLYDTIPTLFPEYFSPFTHLLIRLLKKTAIRSADHCLTISESTRSDVIREYGVGPASISAIPLAADARFQPASPKDIAAARQYYSLPDRYVLCLGSNKPHKNLVRLVEAWALLQEAVPAASLDAVSLVIAGKQDERYPQARRRAQEMAQAVLFPGEIDELHLPGLYSGALCFVFPSLYEGFGLPVLEAMACGTPVACSTTSSLPEVAGEAALCFDPTDVQSMAATIGALLVDEERRSELRERGLIRARRFSWTETARRTLAVYESVAEDRSPLQVRGADGRSSITDAYTASAPIIPEEAA